jgi:hypothetical protein
MRRFLIIAMAMLLVVAAAAPAFAAGPGDDKGQAENAYGTVEHPASDSADATRDQIRLRDQTCDPECDCDCDKLQTRTSTQSQDDEAQGLQARLRIRTQASEEGTGTPQQVRTTYTATVANGLAKEIEALLARLMARLAWAFD